MKKCKKIIITFQICILTLSSVFSNNTTYQNAAKSSTLAPVTIFAENINIIKSHILSVTQLENFLTSNNYDELSQKIVESYKYVSAKIEKEENILNGKHKTSVFFSEETRSATYTAIALITAFIFNVVDITMLDLQIFLNIISTIRQNMTWLEALAVNITISISTLMLSDYLAQLITKNKKEILRTLGVIAAGSVANTFYYLWFEYGVPFILSLSMPKLFLLTGTAFLDIFLIGGIGYSLVFLIMRNWINGIPFERTTKTIINEILFLNKEEPGIRQKLGSFLEQLTLTSKFGTSLKNWNPAFINALINFNANSIKKLSKFLANLNFKTTKNWAKILKKHNRFGGVTYRTNIAVWSIPIIWIYATLNTNTWAIMPIVMTLDVFWLTFLSHRAAKSQTSLINSISKKIITLIDNTDDMYISSELDILEFLSNDLRKMQLQNGELNYVTSEILNKVLKHYRNNRDASKSINFEEAIKQELQLLTKEFNGIYSQGATTIITHKNIDDLIKPKNSKTIIRIPKTDETHIDAFIENISDKLAYPKYSLNAKNNLTAILLLIRSLIRNKGLNDRNDFFFEHGITKGSDLSQYHIKIKGKWSSKSAKKVMNKLKKLGFKNTTGNKPSHFGETEMYFHLHSTSKFPSVIGIKFPIISPPEINEETPFQTAA